MHSNHQNALAERPVEVRLASLASVLNAAKKEGDGWLTDAERRRWSAMRSEVRRHQFLAGHWLVRCLASELYGGVPTRWQFVAKPDGTPTLQFPAQDASQPVPVSLSHSAGWVAAAIAPFPIGIDLEYPSKPRNVLALADATFSPDECTELRDMPRGEQLAAFYWRWTVKEAVGKRDGHGLRRQLARRQQPIACAAGEAEVISWQFSGGYLALAGKRGMNVNAIGLPTGSHERRWRIEETS